jgi:drug/metabolite transporter (DMT)-like permease
MPNKKILDIRVIFSLLTLYIVWGSTYLAIRFLVEAVPPILASGFRNFLAGFFIWCYCYFFEKNELKPNRKDWLIASFSGFLMLSLGNGLLTIAGGWVPSGYMSLFPATVPIWLVVIQYFLGTKPNFLTIIGLVLGLIGVSFLINQEHLTLKGHEDHYFIGVIFLIGASISWACGVMYSVKNPLKLTIAKVSAMQMLVGGSFSLIFSFFYGEFSNFDVNNVSTKAIFAFLYLLIFGSIIGFSVFSWVSKKASPTLVSTYSYVNPLVAIFMGWAFAGEKFSINMFIAALFIITSVVLITFGTAKKL